MIAWISLIIINLILPSKAIVKTKTPLTASVGFKWSLTIVSIPVMIGLLMLAGPSLTYSDPLTISSNIAFTMSIFPIFCGLACISAIIDNFTHICSSMSYTSKQCTIDDMMRNILVIKAEYNMVCESLSCYFFYGIVLLSINFTMDTYSTVDNILKVEIIYIFAMLLLSFGDLCLLHIISSLADKLTNNYYSSINMIR